MFEKSAWTRRREKRQRKEDAEANEEEEEVTSFSSTPESNSESHPLQHFCEQPATESPVRALLLPWHKTPVEHAHRLEYAFSTLLMEEASTGEGEDDAGEGASRRHRHRSVAMPADHEAKQSHSASTSKHTGPLASSGVASKSTLLAQSQIVAVPSPAEEEARRAQEAADPIDSASPPQPLLSSQASLSPSAQPRRTAAPLESTASPQGTNRSGQKGQPLPASDNPLAVPIRPTGGPREARRSTLRCASNRSWPGPRPPTTRKKTSWGARLSFEGYSRHGKQQQGFSSTSVFSSLVAAFVRNATSAMGEPGRNYASTTTAAEIVPTCPQGILTLHTHS